MLLIFRGLREHQRRAIYSALAAIVIYSQFLHVQIHLIKSRSLQRIVEDILAWEKCATDV